MIVYGSRSTKVKYAQLTNEKCGNCQIKGSIFMGIYSKYAHVFWIPMFPIGKIGISQCQHCKQVLTVKQMSPELRYQYESLKMHTKVPIWHFVGLLLIAFIVASTMVSSSISKKNESQYLVYPQIGDIYEYKTDDGNYSTWKILKVSKDSLGISMNKMAITQITGIYKIEKPENYSDNSIWIAKTAALKMYKEGKISSIKRNQN